MMDKTQEEGVQEVQAYTKRRISKKIRRKTVPSYLNSTQCSNERRRITKALSTPNNPLEPSTIGRALVPETEYTTQYSRGLWYKILKQPEHAPSATSACLPSSRGLIYSGGPKLYSHTTSRDEHYYNGQPLTDKNRISQPRPPSVEPKVELSGYAQT